jgi:3-oxoacyl-[acyl-carrier protein] reductase
MTNDSLGIDPKQQTIALITGAGSPTGIGTPDEVASCVAYLCSAGASYLTGQLVVIDGGNSVVEGKGQR